jgi:aryl-phospho-beta-D-glucosidase BglC (GH1 family)
MRATILLAAAAACVASCSSSSSSTSGAPAADASAPPPAAHRTDPAAVHVVGKAFRDGKGRQLLFRGYNAKVTTLFDVTFDDGRVPEETFPDLSETEATRIEQLGWNVLRIPVSWSGLEPHPMQYSAAFMAKLDTVLAKAAAHHFYVFVDMHQDGYSKEIGEDGEPLWAIEPPPTVLLQGPYSDARRTEGPALNAGYSFFLNAPAADGRPLQNAYAEAAQQIVRHVVGNPAVLGYEAFNEPVPQRNSQLDAFHGTFADAVHAVDADAPVLFEPVGTRNQFDAAAIPSSPWSHGPGSYAVHIYTCWFSGCTPGNWSTEDSSALAPSMAHAELERAGWATPLFVTEFGSDQTLPQGPAWMSAELDLQDQYLASSTAWEFSGLGSWGFHDDAGNERPTTTHIMARMFPRAVAGTLLKIDRPKLGDMIVTYQAGSATNGLEHEVSLSTEYVTSPKILCDGAAIALTQATGRATFKCPLKDEGTHTFEVVGTPAQ